METRSSRANNLSVERLAFAFVCLVGLSPVLAHGLWRGFVVALGAAPDGLAQRVTAGAMVTGAVGLAASSWSLQRGERCLVPWALTVAAAAGLGLGLAGGGAAVLSFLAVAVAVCALAPQMLVKLPSSMDGVARRRPVVASLWVLLWGLSMVVVARQTAFIGDPELVRYAIPPNAPHMWWHLCLTAYLHAAELVRAGVPNVYDLALVPEVTHVDQVYPPSAAHMAPFMLDRYGYPPQFILAPLALTALVPDLLAQRALWYGLNGLVWAALLWVLPMWVGDRGGRFALLAAPALWASSSMIFQFGNVQLAVIALGVFAMMAFSERRDAAGGALLAAIALAKIAPGLLGVMLLAQRRWRAVGWTLVFAVLISALSVVVMGWGPFDAFLNYHLPRIASGEAYDFLDDDPLRIRNNLSAFGTPFKLAAMGLLEDPWAIAPRFGSVFTVFALLLAAAAGLRANNRRARAAIWLTVLTVAALRSPMAPPHVLAGVVLALLLVAAEIRTVRGGMAWWGGVLVLCLAVPGPLAPPVWVSLCVQVVLFGTLAWLVLRRWPALN